MQIFTNTNFNFLRWRWYAIAVSLLVLAIGALWILREPERQAWHDKIAGTYVVKVPRGWSI